MPVVAVTEMGLEILTKQCFEAITVINEQPIVTERISTYFQL